MSSKIPTLNPVTNNDMILSHNYLTVPQNIIQVPSCNVIGSFKGNDLTLLSRSLPNLINLHQNSPFAIYIMQHSLCDIVGRDAIQPLVGSFNGNDLALLPRSLTGLINLYHNLPFVLYILRPDITNLQISNTPIQNNISDTDNNINVSEPINTTNILKCEYCKRKFTRKDNLFRHVKLYCNVAKKQKKTAAKQELKSDQPINSDKNTLKNLKQPVLITELDNELNVQTTLEDLNVSTIDNEHNRTLLLDDAQNIQTVFDNLDDSPKIETTLEDSVVATINNGNNNVNNINNTVTNNMTNNNTVNNIVMINYGEENMKENFIEYLLAACKRGYNAIPQLVEFVHFNPDRPDCNNIFVRDTKNKYASVYENGHFIYKNKEAIVDDLYEAKKNFITENIDLVFKQMTKHQQATYKRWIKSEENKDNNQTDREAVGYVREELKLMLFNKRHIPIETMKKCKEQETQLLQ